jgi:hypothetical protein
MIERAAEDWDRLIHGGLILGSLVLADRIEPRFRWIAYGVGGFLAASAFTGWTPALLLLRVAGVKTRAESERERRRVSIAPPAEERRPRPIAVATGRGVPHRIPEEELGLEMAAFGRPRFEDDKPAPSPEGDLGSAD